MICGKKCTLFCLLISIWGAIQLVLMGMSYSLNSLSLIDTLPLKEHYTSLKEFRTDADRLFGDLAIRCYIAAILYALFAIASYLCYCRKKRQQKAKEQPHKSGKKGFKSKRAH
ncbi:ribonuclease kappa [Drosophila hydei]|uniref:Ribonuclease kappa n=1 Tax=Drosophila hydei TaxID=7224 RepID=A0A6J1LTU5_DROHY|nr:ribonuclease kappa [Drosophila hydei]